MTPTNHMVQAVMRAHVCLQVMYLTGWTPHASQQQPSRRGSQTVSFQVGAPLARAARASCCQAARLRGMKGQQSHMHSLLGAPRPCTAKAPGPALSPSCVMLALHEPTFPAGAGGRPQQPRGRRRREYQRGAVAAACPCNYIHVCTLKMSSSWRRRSCTITNPNLEATSTAIQLLALCVVKALAYKQPGLTNGREGPPLPCPHWAVAVMLTSSDRACSTILMCALMRAHCVCWRQEWTVSRTSVLLWSLLALSGTRHSAGGGDTIQSRSSLWCRRKEQSRAALCTPTLGWNTGIRGQAHLVEGPLHFGLKGSLALADDTRGLLQRGLEVEAQACVPAGVKGEG